MLRNTFSAFVYGIDARIVRVETDISNGLPGMEIVGNITTEVREAKERVKIALKNSGFEVLVKKTTINISPADFKKSGTQYDLAIAIGMLACQNETKHYELEKICLLGELKFDGKVSGVRGIISCVIEAKNKGFKTVVVPYDNKEEASAIRGIRTVSVKTLKEAAEFLGVCEKNSLNSYVKKDKLISKENDEILESENIIEFKNINLRRIDFSEIKGQFMAKRAAEIAVAGRHNLLLAGPPGTGKTMLARCMPSIMPPLNYDEQVELTRIYSVAGKLQGKGLIKDRPFRDPHHSVTVSGLIGGGKIPLPGEISYANFGILLMDEFPEFKRESIEVLRQPLEERRIVINRLGGTAVYPADFILVAAMNRCPCGYYPDRSKCRCTSGEIARYMSKVSQPILDRIDLKVDMTLINFDEINSTITYECSASIAQRVMRAVKMQEKRYANKAIRNNSSLSGKETEEYCSLMSSSQKLIKEAYLKKNFSTRSYYRILKVARTIADLEGSENIADRHIREALIYRMIDLKELE